MPSSESEVGRSLPRRSRKSKPSPSTASSPPRSSSRTMPRTTAECLAEAAALGRAVTPVGGGTALSLGNPPERVDYVAFDRTPGGHHRLRADRSRPLGRRWGSVRRRSGSLGRARAASAARSSWRRGRDDRRAHRHRSLGTASLQRGHAARSPDRNRGRAPERHRLQGRRHGRQECLRIRHAAALPRLPRHPRRRRFRQLQGAPSASRRSDGDRCLRRAGEGIFDGQRVAQRPRTDRRARGRIPGRRLAPGDSHRRPGRNRRRGRRPDRRRRAGGDVTRLDGSESAAWWASYVAKHQVAVDENAVLVRCGVRPKETAVLATGMVAAHERTGVATPYLAASPGLGTVVARLDLGSGARDRRIGWPTCKASCSVLPKP